MPLRPSALRTALTRRGPTPIKAHFSTIGREETHRSGWGLRHETLHAAGPRHVPGFWRASRAWACEKRSRPPRPARENDAEQVVPPAREDAVQAPARAHPADRAAGAEARSRASAHGGRGLCHLAGARALDDPARSRRRGARREAVARLDARAQKTRAPEALAPHAREPGLPLFALFVGYLGEEHLGHLEGVASVKDGECMRLVVRPAPVVGLHRREYRLGGVGDEGRGKDRVDADQVE